MRNLIAHDVLSAVSSLLESKSQVRASVGKQVIVRGTLIQNKGTLIPNKASIP